MTTIPKTWLRSALLTLLFSSILGIIGLGTNLVKNDHKPQFAILESKTLVFGKPLPVIRINVFNQFFYKVLENRNQLEVVATNQAHINMGLIAQTYQQSPYSLALSALQVESNNRENSIDIALMLTPKNHSLHIILTQLKR